MDWKPIVVVAIALMLSASVLVPLAAAKDKDKDWDGGGPREFRERGEFREHARGFDFDRDRFGGFGVGGIVPAGFSYPVAFPVSYPPVSITVFTPAYYGGSQGACYQACVNSGMYPPAQCGQMCYYA